MPLHPGTTLGPYSVTAKIGEGGMGEVYRARDTKLERDVALKVLPQAFTDDPDRLARFEREAKVLASLNHPNIGHIYGLEEAEGQKALVLELVEGPTLAERIKQGPIPVDEALPIAKQIAEALEAAHEQGIIHRDLKPANIKVKDDGTVKVLDFGLAKAFQPDASDLNMSQSPTISLTAAATQMGMVIGTAAYMAPEQAKGLPVDKRVDIWAYGAVLFEMLTGRKLFEADDVSEMLASVLVKDPDVSRIGDHVPTHIRSVVRQCLVKDPKERLRDIGDVRLAMAGVFETGAAPAGSTVAASVVQPIWRTLLAPVGAAVGTALLVSLAAWGVMRTEPHQPVRFDHVLPDGLNFGNTGQPMIDVSPDGHTLVYNTTEGLYLRELDELSARLIPGTSANVTNPFFSPDGQTVGYWERSTDELKRVNIAGGAPVTITGAQNPLGVTWERNGTILYGQRDGVWRVAETGGTPELVVPIEEAERVHGPRMLPNDDWVLFTLRPSGASWDQSQVVAQSLTTGERVTLIDVG